MQVLIPMSPKAFERYLDTAIADYAEENVTSGRWAAEGAPERSRVAHEKLLPEGIATKDNYLFNIHDTDGNSVVGSLWMGIENPTGVRAAFIFDVQIKVEHRRQGHATRAFQALETIVRDLKLSTIGLHVFAHNTKAQALYKTLGYEVTSVNMHKQLDVERI